MISLLHESAIPNEFQEVRSSVDVVKSLENLPENSIIFIDVDDTIITPASKTFRKPPYNMLIDEIKKNKDSYPNYEEIVSNWRLQRKARLIDENWPKSLSVLKEKHIVYALTKMDIGKFGNIPSMEEWRYLELKSLGINFSDPFKIPYTVINGSSFNNGIFITGVNSKSQTVENFIHCLGKHTKTIVMIDDRVEYLRELKRFSQDNFYDFVGLLYKGLETIQEEPEPNVALFQKTYLVKNAQWLEDEEAISLMRHQK